MLNKLLFLLGIFALQHVQAQEKIYYCFFKSNSAEYPADSVLKLQNWFQNNADLSTQNLNLIAYSDTLGSMELNDLLGIKRLAKIERILNSEGFKTSETKNIGKRYSKENYSNNAAYRKVEIHASITSKLNEEIQLLNDQEDESNVEFIEVQEEAIALKPGKPENFEEISNNKKVNLNIEFVVNSDVYRDEKSVNQVKKLAEYLKNNTEKKVIILGHVCCSSNYAVSNIRAKKVYDDLRKLGISKNRMKYKGLSNTEPLVPETDLKTEQRNRRVEVVFYD